MKRKTAQKNKRKKPVAAPDFFHSPLIEGIINLIPVLIVFGLFWVNQQPKNIFKAQALETSYNPSTQVLLAKAAAMAGDFNLGQSIYSGVASSGKVLGADTQTENLIFPKKAIETEIINTLDLIAAHPSRYLHLKLAILWWKLGDVNQAKANLDAARSIDPNDTDLTWVASKLFF